MTYNTSDVIVVGGGISGLTSCFELANLGAKVTLLEARDRLGGEIETLSFPKYKVDMGAMYLHSFKPPLSNPLLPLLKRYQIKTTPLDNLNSDTRDTLGNSIQLSELQETLHNEWEEATQKIMLAKNSNANIFPTIAEVLGYDKQPPPHQNSPDYWARKLITATIIQHATAPLTELSLLELTFDTPFMGKDLLVLNGYHQMIDQLLIETLSSKNLTLHLNSVVKSIEQQSHDAHSNRHDTITVTTQNNERYQAEAVLCTLPFSIIQQKSLFKPELPASKIESFKYIKPGFQNKVLLEFDKVFWEDTVHYLYPNDPNIERWPVYLNLYALTDAKVPALLACFYGNDAKFGSKSNRDIVEEALLPLKRVYKEMRPPHYFQVSRWDSDPFSLGGSVYCGKGCQRNHIDALNQPVEGIFFANSYQRIKQGMQNSVEGGFDSGVQAALEIEAYLKNKRQKKSSQKRLKKS